MTTTIRILGAALLVSLALAAACQAKETVQQQHVQPSLASKLIPQPQQPKARSARSLSDMFEKMKSKIFGNRKQQASQASASSSSPSSSSSSSSISPSSSSSLVVGASNQLPSAASINSAQRQPWTEMSFNPQYNPYSVNYQWPSAGSSASGSNQFLLNQPYSSLGGFSVAPSSLGGLEASASQQLGSSLTPATNSNNGGQSSGATGAGSLLTSASHLIAQYLNPSSSSPSSSSSSASIGIGGSPQQSFNGQQAGQSINNAVQLTPQQQQAQSQYQEFASILDSMVSQTGANVQQRPQQQGASIGQYMQSQQQQQQPGANQIQSSGASVLGSGPAADNDMSGSSNIQSYMPQASQQPASQKSGMVGLAEQLSPGSQFNKLVSFPFSLTSNDDPSKDGRFKLHIPFLNNHVKRSDQQAAAAAAAVAAQQQQNAQLRSQQKAQQQQQQQQQQFQQYMNNYYNQLYASSIVGQQQQQQQQPQQISAQASQVVPTIVSPQLSSSSSSQSSPVSVAGAQISQSPSSSIQSSPSSSSSLSSSSSASSSSMQSSASQSSSSATSSLVPVGQSSNSRPAWSVSDIQSGSPSIPSSSSISSSSSSSSGSSSKLIPIQSAAIPASSSIEQNSQN